jgi:hypothetical protein
MHEKYFGNTKKRIRFVPMEKSKSKKKMSETKSAPKLITVKIDESLYNQVKAHKKETYMPISVFVEEAIREKLKRTKGK